MNILQRLWPTWQSKEAERALYNEFASDHLEQRRYNRAFAPVNTTDEARIAQEVNMCWTIRPTLCGEELCSEPGDFYGWCLEHLHYANEYDSVFAANHATAA